MYTLSPTKVELYYLCLLLLHVQGCKSYEDIRTYRNRLYPTFQESAKAMGLLQDDNANNAALTEASLSSMSYQLRRPLVTICVFDEPSDPLRLWDNHKDSLSEDFINQSSTATVALLMKSASRVFIPGLILLYGAFRSCVFCSTFPASRRIEEDVLKGNHRRRKNIFRLDVGLRLTRIG